MRCAAAGNLLTLNVATSGSQHRHYSHTLRSPTSSVGISPKHPLSSVVENGGVGPMARPTAQCAGRRWEPHPVPGWATPSGYLKTTTILLGTEGASVNPQVHSRGGARICGLWCSRRNPTTEAVWRRSIPRREIQTDTAQDLTSSTPLIGQL